jgi:hypothetical protein
MAKDTDLLAPFIDFFQCAEALVRERIQSLSFGSLNLNQTNRIIVYFLVTDSDTLRRAALSYFTRLKKMMSKDTPRIIVTGLPIAHLHKFRPSHLPWLRLNRLEASDQAKVRADLARFSVIENYILSSIRLRVISRGGYGKLAVLLSAPYFTDHAGHGGDDSVDVDANLDGDVLPAWIRESTLQLTPRHNTDISKLAPRPDEDARPPGTVCAHGAPSGLHVGIEELGAEWSLA